MDPDETLREIRALCDQITLDVDDCDRLRELVVALDHWLLRGGFLPTQWKDV